MPFRSKFYDFLYQEYALLNCLIYCSLTLNNSYQQLHKDVEGLQAFQ